MKTYFFAFIFVVLAFCSCEKVDLSEYLGTDEDGYKTTFVFNVITQSDFDQSGTRTVKNIKDVAGVMNIAIFQDGAKLKTVNMKSDDASFGTLTLSLPEGEYEIVAVAHSGSGNATFTSPEKIAFANNKVTDTFSFYRSISVNSSKEYDATMTRVVSMFRLCVEQAIPDEVAQMKFYYTGGSSTLNAVTGYGCVNSRQTEFRDVDNHKAGQVFEVYTFPHEDEGHLNMTITALDAKGDTHTEKALANVPVTIRRISTYSTPFFGSVQNNSQSSITFKADDAWDGEDKYTF